MEPIESKPTSIVSAVRAIYLASVVGFTAAATWLAMGAGRELPLPVAAFFLPSLLYQFGIPALLAYGISTRKGWARIIYVVLTVPGVLLGVLNWILEFQKIPVLVSIDVILTVVQIYALYLLFTRSSNRWFKQARAA